MSNVGEGKIYLSLLGLESLEASGLVVSGLEVSTLAPSESTSLSVTLSPAPTTWPAGGVDLALTLGADGEAQFHQGCAGVETTPAGGPAHWARTTTRAFSCTHSLSKRSHRNPTKILGPPVHTQLLRLAQFKENL